MSMVEQVRRLSRWDTWANRVVGDVLRQSDGQPPNALAAYQHVLEAHLNWLRRIGGTPDNNVQLWAPASLEQVARFEDEAFARMADLGASVDDAYLDRTFSYKTSRGQPFTDRIEDVLVHVFLHSQQYRGEAAAFLNAAGHRVPDIDFIFWMRLGEPDSP